MIIKHIYSSQKIKDIVKEPEVQLEEKYEIVEEDSLDLDLEYILSDEDIEE